MSDLYGFVVWIESILNQSIILIECVRVLSLKSSRTCGLSERSMRIEVCQPTGGKFSHILT